MAQKMVSTLNPEHQDINQKKHIKYHGASDGQQKVGKLNVSDHFHGKSQAGLLVERKAGCHAEQKGIENDQKQHKTEPGKSPEEIAGDKMPEIHKGFPVNVF